MSKNETINCLRLRIWRLIPPVKAAGGYLRMPISWGDDASIHIIISIYGEQYARLMYQKPDSMTGEKRNFDYKVPLVATRCHLGGFRFWFKCPLLRKGVVCNRRVGVLYLDGNYFGCRQCHNLAYRSQHENRRSIFGQFFGSYDIEEKAEQLENEAKRFTYRGKPTKKWRKIESLYERACSSRVLSIGRHIKREYGKEEL